ncbi:uncharacterized protein LOC124880908 [Girardinichthys multiradiatus]|uniref:uncharacterized protein LOC124880908 n=1 Tax=Girardinichthys multiradiatus TaxID=208333 RepID=UPI001FAC0218|nr:uncharacterized protein LOC124880908 [Girardinichthys multiradiatus]
MVLLFFTHLLLVALLFQHTEANKEFKREKSPKRDETVHYEEFCLHVPEYPDSHGSLFGTHLSTKPVSPTKTTTQKPKMRKLPKKQNKRPKRPTSPFDGDTDLVVPQSAPVDMRSPEGCYCTEKNKKSSTETSRVKSLKIQFPSETCNSTEHIETLMDGRKVCTTNFSLITHLRRFLSKPTPVPGPTESPEVSFIVRQTPSEEKSSTTQLAFITNWPPPLLPSKELYDDPLNQDDFSNISNCKLCNPFMENLDDVDLKAVQFLDVIKQSPLCAFNIYINQNDGRVFCSNVSSSKILLQNLEIPLPQEENAVAGCRCYEKAKKRPAETLPVTRARIWLSSENCSSAEFIETLSDGREVCVTPPSLVTYLDTWEEHHVGVYITELRTIEHYPEFSLSNSISMEPMERKHCMQCLYLVNWDILDPKDVQSLTMNLPSSDCPAIITVSLIDGEDICMDSSNRGFVKLLEKFELKEPDEP